MIKKIIGLIVIVLLLTGCSVDYNLYIDKSNVSEEIIFNGETIRLQPYPVFYDADGFSENGTKLPDVIYYEMNNTNNNTVLSYIFDWNDYSRSRAPRTCLKSHNLVRKNDNTYMLSTSAGISCFNQYSNLDSINVSIKLNSDYYTFISKNADSGYNGTYIWNITRDNEKTKHVQMIFKDKENREVPNDNPYNEVPTPNDKKENPKLEEIREVSKNHMGLIIGGSFFLLFIVLFIIIKIKSRKR